MTDALTYHFVLFSLGKPAVGISKTDYREQYGSRVSLNCRITPDLKFPSVHVFWRKNISGTMVLIQRGQGKEGMTLDNPSLIIDKANFADSGRYICYARDNSATVQSPTISLTILGGKLSYRYTPCLISLNE